MEPGSSATFCTESLARRLNVQGRKVDMIVKHHELKKRVESYVLTDLEVMVWKKTTLLNLPKCLHKRASQSQWKTLHNNMILISGHTSVK